MNWLRLYTETIHDRKLRRLPPAQRWLWVAILCVARQSPRPGYLLLGEGVPVTADDLVDTAAVDRADVDAGIKAFLEQRMLHMEDDVMVVTHWSARQFGSDDPNERVRRHRERQRQEVQKSSDPDVAEAIRNGDVTLQKRFHRVTRNVTVTPPDSEADTESSNPKIDSLSAALGADALGGDDVSTLLPEIAQEAKLAVDAKKLERVVRMHLPKLGADRMVIEAGKAAEWIGDHSKRKMSLRFLDNWFDGAAKPRAPALAALKAIGTNGHARLAPSEINLAAIPEFSA